MAVTIDQYQPDEQLLIRRALCGDRAAYGELVTRHQQGVVNVVYRMCGDSQLAQEAAQEAFLRAWQHLDRYQPDQPFRNWIYRIALNAALDALRRARPMLSAESVALPSQEPNPESMLEIKQRAEQVRQAVLALPDACRSVLVLREYEAMTYREIAAILEIPLGTVMSRLNYARCQLRQSLAALMEVG